MRGARPVSNTETWSSHAPEMLPMMPATLAGGGGWLKRPRRPGPDPTRTPRRARANRATLPELYSSEPTANLAPPRPTHAQPPPPRSEVRHVRRALRHGDLPRRRG